MENPNKKTEEIYCHKQQVENTANIFTRIDSQKINAGKKELRLFAIARNEALRLPYFLKYYFKMGVDRIFLIDNGSTDETVNIALQYSNVHIFKIERDFKEFWYWIEFFLNKYGLNRWCLVVDIDELVKLPLQECITLQQFVKYLTKYKYTAYRSLLLDLYSDKPIQDTMYLPGENPLKTIKYFDNDYSLVTNNFFDKKRWKDFSWPMAYGGARQRVFGQTNGNKWFFCLSKVPLFKYSEDIYLTEGMHAINGALIADIEGVVFHTKFLHDFIPEVEEQSIRQQHYMNGIEYKIYQTHISNNSQLKLINDRSIKYKNTYQLINVGLMKISNPYISFIEQL